MAIDRKYGVIPLKHVGVGEDEPVVVFRAQDALLPELLSFYRQLCEAEGSPPHHLTGINDTRDIVLRWQATHHTQVPQSAGQAPQA